MLTDKEKAVKDFMERRLVTSLDDTFKHANPKVYEMYNGNFCRQAAVFGIKFLEELLPEYNWQGWDGIFDDMVLGKKRRFNHAWIYGEHESQGKKLLIDLSRQYQERLFILVDKNQYPKEHPEYKHTKILSSELIDINEKLVEKEFYTDMKGDRLLNKLKRVTKFDDFKEKLLKEYQ